MVCGTTVKSDGTVQCKSVSWVFIPGRLRVPGRVQDLGPLEPSWYSWISHRPVRSRVWGFAQTFVSAWNSLCLLNAYQAFQFHEACCPIPCSTCCLIHTHGSPLWALMSICFQDLAQGHVLHLHIRVPSQIQNRSAEGPKSPAVVYEVFWWEETKHHRFCVVLSYSHIIKTHQDARMDAQHTTCVTTSPHWVPKTGPSNWGRFLSHIQNVTVYINTTWNHITTK